MDFDKDSKLTRFVYSDFQDGLDLFLLPISAEIDRISAAAGGAGGTIFRVAV